MSTQDYYMNDGQTGLDGQGLNQTAKGQMGGSVRDQLNANSAEERDELRVNASSLPPAILDSIDDTVMAPMYDNLVLVQLFEEAELTHDLQWWETETSWGIRGRMNEAEHSSDLMTRSEEGALAQGREGIAVPYTIKDYRIPQAQIEKAIAYGTDIEAQYAEGAGESASELLEDTMLYGSRIQLTTQQGYTLGCPGMLNVEGRLQQPTSGTWDDGPTAKNDVLEGIGQLKDRKYYAEGSGMWLLTATKQDTYFNRDYETTAINDTSTRDRLEEISDLDRIVHVPRMPDGEAVLFKPSPQVIDMARLPDGPLNLSWDSHGGVVNQFKLYHLLAPRIKHNQDGNTGIVHFAGAGTDSEA
ncbi:encapsulin [Halalkalicoccus jeotgali]|uniref:Linocin_M18 bacteriocin protein n=1 Tax=Halalkalicoccus jeotgali (strain DSM 18796 / CECT 7217 / JCM 14584 / KCTC 4019 / B3) TaxID=795797 RepID=D8J9V9_HALJB|nr:encapsulin [Halalkalicoccus jeotgali]ADJ14481.1 Linocin_M18 bacteriocin protein [Halalkalicoccus jeotgali B3]ELY40195.1 Linocin_M18 bacteriocin protein [Halalkalicoccus jeotgali B3]